MNIRNIKAAIQGNPDREYWVKLHRDENRAFDAGVNGLPFPNDLVFRGRLAQAWWDGIYEAKHTNQGGMR